MTAVIYEAAGTVAATALPVQRARVIETPAVYETVMVPAVTEERQTPGRIEQQQDGSYTVVEPPQTVTVEVAPAREEQRLVAEAVYRDETTEEMVARLIAAGLMPDLPWTRHMIAADTPPGAHGTHWTIDWATAAVTMLPPPPPAVPQQVTNYQARAALLAAGLFEQVDAAVKAQGPTSAAFQAWEYANSVYRNSPLIAGLGAALGLTAAQIDDLFRAAAAIDS